MVDALVAAGGPSFLIFETLAERTLALAQLARRLDPDAGYEPLLDELLRPVLARCLDHGIRIVSNFGAANPRGAARRIAALAAELGLKAPRIAVVEGDDVGAAAQRPLLRDALGASADLDAVMETMVCANAYLGADAIADALLAGADIVVTGRVADPSLTVGPALAHFGWRRDDWDRLARATMAGHLLECGAQVTGGYYADPGYKDVPDLARVGYPIAEIDADGHCTITKPPGTGGRIDVAHREGAAALRSARPGGLPHARRRRRPERGARRRARPGSRPRRRRSRPSAPGDLEGQRLLRAGLARRGRDLVRRAARRGACPSRRAGAARAPRRARRLRVDLIGVASILGDDAGAYLSAQSHGEARDVRLRVAALHDDKARAERLPREVTALYTCGPAGGGGVRTALRQRLSTRSCFVPRDGVPARFAMMEPA